MALALEARAMKDDIMLGDTPKAVNRRGRIKDFQTAGRLWKHSKLSDLMGLVSPDEVSDFFTFTLCEIHGRGWLATAIGCNCNRLIMWLSGWPSAIHLTGS